MKKKTRRDFVKDAGFIGGAFALYGCSTPGGTDRPPVVDPPETPEPPFTGTRVRRSVTTLAPNGPELRAYRAAVTAMRELPASDPRSWAAQANIHASACPHGNWFFLPWHRAYLHRFEQICAEMSGVPDFALPYWDWSTSPTIPAAFWGGGNVLNHPRGIGQGDSFDADLIGPTAINNILGISDPVTFASGPSPTQRGSAAQGQLESGPHNYVHGRIGADMGTFQSPQDPIFWLHHANIDRLWTAWRARGNQDFDDATWRGFEFTNSFFDGAGAAVRDTVASTLSTAGLGYRYDTQTGGFGLEAAPMIAGRDSFDPQASVRLAPPPVVVPGTTTERTIVAGVRRIEALRTASASIRPTNELRALLGQRTGAAPAEAFRLEAIVPGEPGAARAPAPAAAPGGTARLTIQGIEEPSQPTIIRVFLNAAEVTIDTPSTDPHYVGSFTFFGGDHGDHAGMAHGDGTLTFHLDFGPCIERLARAGLWTPETDTLDVQLSLVPLNGDRAGYSTSIPAPNKIAIAYVR